MKPTKKKAFALLMSLVLMSFFVVLVLTLSAIVQAELRATKQNILEQKAKMAAKVAAFQALGEVQKALGADQRITANASILDNDINDVFDYFEDNLDYDFWNQEPAFNRDDINLIDGIANPHWLGVWDSTPGMHPLKRINEEDRQSYAERVLYYSSGFLVSGNNTIKRDSNIPSEELLFEYSPVDELTGDYVNMLRKNSITDENGEYDTDTMRVRVPLVTLERTDEEKSRSSLQTRIAWWVSDESQKAPVNVIATEEEFEIMNSDSEKTPLLQSIPFKNGMQALSTPEDSIAFFDVDLNSSEDRAYVRALNDISQLDVFQNTNLGDFSASKFLYNSVAMNTKGLPVNVRYGGMKKDLSVGLLAKTPETLRDDPNFFERPMGVEGYDAYLSNPMGDDGKRQYNVFQENSVYDDKKGHMFGPQAVENIGQTYVGLTYSANNEDVNDMSDVHKDPGGPLWDSLRDYYNNRVDQSGIDIHSSSGGYANMVKTKTDVSTGLSPVLLHYQLFSYPTLTEYSSGYGVRIYIIPLVVLWNPYNVEIEKGSTYAFSAGRGSPCPFGSFRVAVGTVSDGIFSALRDIRAESMPRPLPNLEGETFYSYINGAAVSSTYSFSSLYGQSEQDLNFYRAVSFSLEGYYDRIGVVSASADGLESTGYVKSGNVTGVFKPMNKSYFGYGNWRYEDTRSLVSGVEDSEYFPQDSDNSIDKTGLVRIYKKAPNSGATMSLGTGGRTVEVTLPDHYYLSSESFYYRKLYLNNLKASVSWTGQAYLPNGGSYIKDDDAFREAYITQRAKPNEDSFRFLVYCEEALKGGEAKIFTLKESVPYHYKYNGEDGYAGVLEQAYKSKWYLTEGVDTSSIGGYFLDVMHPERTHLASKGNNLGSERFPTYDIADLKNVEFDPHTVCAYDGKELGVLFDLSESRNFGYSDESEEGNSSISISDIYIDIDHLSTESTGVPFQHNITPYYIPAGSAFNANPWWRTSFSYSSSSESVTGLHLLRTDAANTHNFSLQFSDLIMWNYLEDGGDNDYPYYLNEYGAVGVLGNLAANNFQSLKRFVVARSDFAAPFSIESFPDPLKVVNDDNSNYKAYFYLEESMVPFYGSTYGSSHTNNHPGYAEQSLFVGSSNTGTSYDDYGVNVNYTSNVAKETILTDFVDTIRDKVRGYNVPMFNSNGYTIYDGYYKKIMSYVNEQIVMKGGSAYTDSQYETFLEAIGITEDLFAGSPWIWEDPYFLLRNPRRVAYPRWTTQGAIDSYTERYLYWSDNIPKATNVQSAQIVSATDTSGIALSTLKLNEAKSLMSFEAVTAYRPVSNELEADSSDEWFFQYPFKFPWLTQTNATAKLFADGRYGNAGAFRDRSYGTDGSELRGGSSATACSFFGYGAIGNNLVYSAAQYAGDEGTEGNFKMGDIFSFYIDKYGSNQVQVGPDVLSSEGYEYTLKHFLRKYEVVASPADLATAELVFGAEVDRNFGVGTATADIYYPNNIIGASFSQMRIAPERHYDYIWIDAVDTTARTYINRYNTYGDGIRNEDESTSYSDETRHVAYDITWHINDILWDEYFFSTIPYNSYQQNDMDSYYEYLIPKNPRIHYINKARDKIYTRINDSTIYTLDNKITDMENLDYDYDLNSSRVWVNGPFNVNSTNIDAWKMVLGTSFGNTIYGYDGTSVEVEDKAPLPRNGTAYSATEFDSTTVRNNEKKAMQGFRALSRAELEELAMSMVENVKDRGPFFSLADFMNRSVEIHSNEMIRMGSEDGYYLYDFSNDFWEYPKDNYEELKENANEASNSNFFLRQDHMQKGVMQAAIDLTSINKAFFDDAYLVEYSDSNAALNSKYTKIVENNEYSLSYSVYGSSIDYTPDLIEAFWSDFGNPRNAWENYRAVLGSTLAGAPAYVTQSDIIKQIGSFITVRGDTFKIRAYGEIHNPLTDEVQAKAWCEMLIQRYPEYIDASKNVSTDVSYREKEFGYQGGRAEYDTILEQLNDSVLNEILGRRFKVVSFRWLSENEI